ncbi:MAG: nucleotidyltransferase domain-containing protein [Anaerolineales bacterium]
MDTATTAILHELREGLTQVLGPQLNRVLLYGSRARGDARADSDYDVLVVVNGEFDYADLLRRTSALVSGLSLAHDIVISRVFVTREQFEREQSPFLLNARRESVPI